MSPKRHKQAKPAVSSHSSVKVFKDRNGLAAYTTSPESFGPERIVYSNSDFVVINDLYPKATVHLLILPRDDVKASLHPFDALTDATFLSRVKEEVERCKDIAAAELKRRYGMMSASSSAYNAAMEKAMEDASATPPDPSTLPPQRNWRLDVNAGIHAHPSMNHLHIHIISSDMHSPAMKHRKHYNSFNTDFFVPIEDFPLADDDARRHPGREGFLKNDLRCWKCNMNFGNQFARLKEHLETEWEAWRRE
jgi:aprataxin